MAALIYQAVNLVNGKRYIGVTIRTLHRRRREHFNAAAKGSDTVFHRAIQKYGRAMFRFSVLLECSPDSASSEEVRLICLFKPEYNSAPGGTRVGPYPESGKERLSAAAKVYRKGFMPALHVLESLSTGRKKASENRKKKVVCVQDVLVFMSGREAAKFYGISPSMMCLVLSGKRKTAAGKNFAVVSEH
jgi:group I intron endonuclease